MAGAPDVITNPLQQPSTTDAGTDAIAQMFRGKQVAQQIPVWQPSYQFSVPINSYNRGWVAPDVPTIPGPTYPRLVQAPDVVYTTKSYSTLVVKSANPPLVVNREPTQLTAPPIETTY